MLWQGREGSSNVDDRRGISGGGLLAGGGIVGVIILVINFFLGGGDASQLPQVIEQGTQQGQQMDPAEKAADDKRADFVKVVLKDTENIWSSIFRQNGKNYSYPTMVLFTRSVASACGNASSATGPFYCPGDQMLYIDLSFYQQLTERFNAPGDFAMAYVVAHEVGHHIQTLLGTTERVSRLRSQMSEREYNKYSVMVELQADYYAGVWAHYEKTLSTADKRSVLEEGDIEEALNAANAIGDDRLQKEAQGEVVPDSFTHGTSQQRMLWFKKGFESGDMTKGDTFSAVELQR